MRLRTRTVGAATLFVAALTVVSGPRPQAASASDVHCPPGLGIGLQEEPQALAKDPRASHYIIDFVRPGTTFSRKVLICNGESRPLHVDLYAAGARIHDGTFDINAAPAADAVSQWGSVQPTAVTLAGGASRTVTATVAVPADAPKGEYYGAIVAAHPAPETGVGVSARAAIRVYLAVGSGGLPPTNFRIDSLTAARADDGTPYVLAQITNTGQRAIDLSGTLKLGDGPGGLSAGPFPARLGTTLAPRQSEPVTVPLDKSIPAGPWLATLDLTSGLLERKADATISFPVGSGARAAPVQAHAVPLTQNRGVVIPIAIGLILAACILLLLIWWRRRRRGEQEHDRQSEVALSSQ